MKYVPFVLYIIGSLFFLRKTPRAAICFIAGSIVAMLQL